ncbi:protein fuzzy homolog isoform X2 [Daktulosphaira vitifoliae]|uniref:protein fuzzy homolog isoform X2 n=1 Tax=Daktulosphaira vitifoliae TaxID=58002 RepID=UPI0021A9E2F4|nr:protein fuzzy homolog isoform X2 [Daktulosphaira vitifoliae]
MLDVVCTTVNGGIPIFYRKKSSSDPIPFSTLSTLNAIVTFAEVQNVLFQNIHTDKHVFIWHNIDNRLIIAGISNLNDSIVTSCLELISNLIKIMVGEENLSIKNNDRLKREIKPCIPVIDYLLSILKSKSIDKSLLSHLEVQSLKENKVIHNCLYNWSEIICSDLCWIIVDKKICAATNDWWNLHITERKLLSLIILSNCYELNTSADIPIFLPRLYQKSLLRLVCCMIVQGVWIAAICGPNPSLDNIEISAAKSFRSVISHFRPNYSKAELTSGYIIINPQMTQFIQNYYSTTTDVQNILQHFYETIVSKFIKDIMQDKLFNNI